MSKSAPITSQLIKIKNGDATGVVTFHFADGTKQTQSINKDIFFDEKGKNLDLYKVVQKFNDICHDIKAIKYEIE